MAKKRNGAARADAGDGVPSPSTDIPETRQHVSAQLRAIEAEPGPVDRASAASLEGPLDYRDDSPFAAGLRKLDHYVGVGEQIVLVGLIGLIVLTAATVALADKIADVHLGHKDEILRAGTFAIAMIGAAFASHQQRHLAMDMVARRLSQRGRLVLRVVIALVVIAFVALLVKIGNDVRAGEVVLNDNNSMSDSLVPTGKVAALIPIGGALIILHTLLHALIDVDYLRRGKLPPERVRSAH